jgi:thiamine biosynthesis lipoprotein
MAVAVVFVLTLLFLFLVGEQDRLPAWVPSASVTETPVSSPVVSPDVVDEAHRFEFARENILGTSLDLLVIGDDPDQAKGVEARILEEIEKREMLISTYRTDSEISLINARPFAASEQIEVSYSLWLLLEECRHVGRQSGGAFNAFAGNAVKLWRQAAKTGVQPAKPDLAAAAASSRAGFEISSRRNGRWVRRLAPGSFDFDGIGKGYVIDKAVREAVEAFPKIRGLRLNIGGEIKVWGQADYAENRPWRIGIANPERPADNAAPIAEIEVRNLAVATSGDYARSLRIAGASVNHILDPRTARPVDHVRSATVVASTAQRADALATALCVMAPEDGLTMIEAMSDAACLIIDASGRQYRSAAFATLEASPKPATKGAWPAGRSVSIQFELVRSENVAPFHRHYVGAWVENESGRRVRILALWAKPADLRYVQDLDEFWRDAWLFAGEGTDTGKMLGVSRATRPPGEYKLLWDGLDDSGQAVPQGVYTIHLDVNREKGPPDRRERHTHVMMKLNCGAEPDTARAEDRPELRNVQAVYTSTRGGDE